MKRIQLDDDVQQFLLSHSVELGESASSILRRELHLPLPPGSVEIDDDVYAFLVSRMQTIGESASSILRRELRLGSPPPAGPSGPSEPEHPPAPGPRIIEFRIAAGTGAGAWNTPTTAVIATVGDTLRIVNGDSVAHLPHTSGRPFPHPNVTIPIAPGQSADFPLTQSFDPRPNSPLTDHLTGGQFWIEVRPQP